MYSRNKFPKKGKPSHYKCIQWLNSLKVGQKIALGYFIVLGITIFGTITGIFISNYYIQDAKKRIENATKEIELPRKLEHHIFSTIHLHQSLIIDLDSLDISQKKIDLFRYHIEQFMNSLAELKTHNEQKKELAETQQENEMISHIIENYEEPIIDYLDTIKPLVKILEQSLSKSEDNEQLEILLLKSNDDKIHAHIQAFSWEVDKFLALVSQEHQESLEILDKATKLTSYIILGSFSLSILSACLLAFIFGRAISRPLQALQFSVDEASEIIFWFDSQGRLIYVNKSASLYFGQQPQELLQMRIIDLDIELFSSSWTEFWHKLETLSSIRFESTINNKIGCNYSVEIDVSQIDVEGITYGCAFARDITQRKESERKLVLAQKSAEAANQAKSEFLANMTHELQTPLNSVLGFTQLMNRDRNLTPKQLKNLQTINRSGEHLLSLIDDVLNFSKIESGQLTLNQKSFDFNYLLNSLAEMFKLKADKKGIKLFLDYSWEVPQYIKTDEQKLRQVLINLLSNSIKFTQQGQVTLRARVSRDQQESIIINFEVEDTGDGIAPEELNYLFHSFVQTSTGKKFQEGTGLGLPISRNFIELMGGNIAVKSEVNQGTVVSFNIVVQPANLEEIPEKAVYRQVIGLASDQPKYRILVVDDRWENRQLLIQLLEFVGFEVQEAENGQQALSIWSTWKPHLIWMDMRMPVLDGYQATQQIKSHLQGQSTAIIALTSSAFEEQRSAIIAAGCDDYVSKPFEESIIWDKMTEHLGVKYVYEEIDLAAQNEQDDSFTLEAFALQIMPADWIAKLEQAALELREELIAELLQQIPDEHVLLTQALQDRLDLLHNYDNF